MRKLYYAGNEKVKFSRSNIAQIKQKKSLN